MEMQTAATANIAELQREAEADTSWTQGFIVKRTACLVAGCSGKSLDRKIAAGTFPDAIVRDGNYARWDGATVMRWRMERIAKPAKLIEDRERERQHRQEQKNKIAA